MQEFTSNLGTYQVLVDAAVGKMEAEGVIPRIWGHDHTIWKPEPTEITNRLGWLQGPQTMRDIIPNLAALVKEVQEAGYTHVLHLGMGGSSLAADVFSRTFDAQQGYLDLIVLDSTDPGSVLTLTERLDLGRTLFVVATKSGSTAETLSFFKFFYNWLSIAFEPEVAGEHFVAITDPGSKLVNLAEQYSFREVCFNDPYVGGRYSVFSYFGLLPAALIGMDLPRLLEQVEHASEVCAPTNPVKKNVGAYLGAILGALAKEGRDKLTLVASPEIASFGDWVEQLVAESTGKEGQGILPVVGEPLGVPDVYGQDRVFVQLRLADDTSADDALAKLEAAGHPVVRFTLADSYALGQQFFIWEVATAVAGYHLGINPFNQPNVESAKVQARRMIDAYKEKGVLPEGKAMAPKAETLNKFLSQGCAGDYIAIQAYVQPTPETDAALTALQVNLRDRFKLATTVGYGPRFLHSTGQLHKGDAGKGLFIQLVAPAPRDAPIPDTTGKSGSPLTFDVLKTAQALGDRQALSDAGRRVICFKLEDDILTGLRHLIV